MSQRDFEFEDTLPLELKLRVLQAELDRLEADFGWLKRRKEEIEHQIKDYERRISKTRRRNVLRRIK